MNKLLHILTRFGTLVILALLCIGFSIATWDDYHPDRPQDARKLARQIAAESPDAHVLIVVPKGKDNQEFAAQLEQTLAATKVQVLGTVQGGAVDARNKLVELGESNTRVDYVATHYFAAQIWRPLRPEGFDPLKAQYPSLAQTVVWYPSSYKWPVFLRRENVLTVLNLISVTAIVAIGMTLVIITAGIDLSVGSLIALAMVTAAWVFRYFGEGGEPTLFGLCVGSLTAIGLCALLGLVNGGLVTGFGLPAFIVTLGMMSIARGLAYKISGGSEPIDFNSELFHRLAMGRDLLGIPNPVTLTAILYLTAHFVMTRTTLGRFIYAIGGNAEAARLSGVPVKRVLLLVYAVCGAMCALGGLIYASKHDDGQPNLALGDELQIIAAVVVGGTSLAGGEGKVMGTLVGALILAVISNGMLLLKVDTFSQMIVFGLLILGAAIIDRLKLRSWKFN